MFRVNYLKSGNELVMLVVQRDEVRTVVYVVVDRLLSCPQALV